MRTTLLAWTAALPLAAAEPAFERIAFPMPERCDAVVALDVDNNGHLDLVAICRTKVIAILLPQREQRVIFDAGDGGMIHATTWDADGDGDLDLAVIRFAAGEGGDGFTLAWLENPGWKLHVLDSETGGTHGVASGDLNGDGRDDLVTANVLGDFPGSVTWYPGATGERNFLQREEAGPRPHYLATADVTGNGLTDVFFGDGGGFRLFVNPGPEKSGGKWPVEIIDRQPGGTNVAIADLDGDGRPELIGSNGHGRGLFWYDYPGLKRHPVELEMSDIHALAAGDLNGDGHIDLVAGSFGGFQGSEAEKDAAKIVRWYENDGSGTFTAHDLDSGQESYAIQIVDLDGDGHNDIILAGRMSENVVWYRNLGR